MSAASNLKGAIAAVVGGRDLTEAEMTTAMRAIVAGEATSAQIAAFLVALRMKGESVTEIAAAARALREAATPVHAGMETVLDTCGTGGDGRSTFNISTAAALVAAGAGVAVAKHGNRAVSGRSGGADVLERLGVRLDLTAEQIGRCLREVGIAFLFAPTFHSGMRHALGPRREIGIRTVFNVLGPLANPVRPRYQLVGVYAARLTVPLAEVLGALGAVRALVVHGEGGLDELSLAGQSVVAEWDGTRVRRYTVEPEECGLGRAPVASLEVHDAGEAAAVLREVLGGAAGPRRDIVLFNAGAALYAAGAAPTMAAGVERARRSLDGGAARAKLEALVRFCRETASA